MQDEVDKTNKDIEYEKLINNLISTKIMNITAKQEIEYQLMKMDVPLKLPELPDGI